MNSILFGVFSVAILVIIWWYVENERSGVDSDGDKGLLAMRKSPAGSEKAVRRAANQR